MLASGLAGFFTIPHFDGFSAVLIELDQAELGAVTEALTDGWLACAPPKLSSQLPAGREPGIVPLTGAQPGAARWSTATSRSSAVYRPPSRSRSQSWSWSGSISVRPTEPCSITVRRIALAKMLTYTRLPKST